MAEILDSLLSTYTAGLNETVVKDTLLGVGFIVLNESGIIYSGTAGRQGFDLGSPAYSTDSIQWIASMTKIITATCLLQIVGKGLVTLTEDLRPRIPELANLTILNGFDNDGQAILVENTEPVTLRHLLTHTSGFAYDLMIPDLMRWSDSINRTVDANSWSIEGYTTPLLFPPGQGWMYGTSLDWAGIVLERLTNQSLEEYMKEHIFTPLCMGSTAHNISTIPNIDDRLADWAAATTSDPTILAPGTPSIPYSNYTQYSGGAGLHSGTADYAKFLLATLQGRLLSQPERDLMFTPSLTPTEQEAFTAALSGDQWDFYTPEIFPKGAPVSHGISGAINLEDSPGRRKAGSLMWSGASNGRWWVDRESGIAAVMTTQVEPFNYPVAVELFKKLEEVVYQHFV